MLNFINYYKLLGISYDSSIEEIKRAYSIKLNEINLSIDKFNNLDQDKVKELHRLISSLKVGYKTLTDEESKKLYDNMLRNVEQKNVEIDIDKVINIVKNRKPLDEIKKNEITSTESRNQSNRIFSEISDNEGNDTVFVEDDKELPDFFQLKNKPNVPSINVTSKNKKAIFNVLNETNEEIEVEEEKKEFVPKLRLIKSPIISSEIEESDDEKYFHEFIDDEYLTPTPTMVEKNKFYNKLKLYNLNKIVNFVKNNYSTILIGLSGIIIAGIITNIKDSSIESLNSYDEEKNTGKDNSVIEDSIDFNEDIILYNYYTILPNDTLNDISLKTNVALDDIKYYNNLQDNDIYAGDSLIIPYSIKYKDISKFSIKATYDKDMDLESYAKLYNTNINTLLILNPNSILKINNQYVVVDDSIYVPNFSIDNNKILKK